MHGFVRRLRVSPCGVAAAAMFVAACSGGPARVPLIVIPETGTGGGASIDSATLRAQAESIVRIRFNRAMRGEVIGTPGFGSADTAADVTRMEFRFAADRTNPAGGTVWIDATGGRFGNVQTTSRQLSDTTFAELPTSLTLERAVTLMRDAGFTGAFRRVIFRQLPSGANEATYAFQMTNNEYILVGASTGTVSQAASQPEPDTLVPNT